jgi:hypothetical protein
MSHQKPKFDWHPITSGPGLRVTSGEVAGVELAPGLWFRRNAGGFEVGVVEQRSKARPARGSAVLTAARDAVLGLPLEAAVVEAAVEQIERGEPLDDDDRRRLRLARERAQAVRRLIADAEAAHGA